MTLGERLRIVIDASGMTVRQFAKKMGVPYRSLHEYLSDKRKPSFDLIEGFVRHGYDVQWLIIGKVPPILEIDLTNLADARPLTGVLGVDPEYRNLLMREAILVVDDLMKGIPNEEVDANFVSTVCSVWNIYSFLVNTMSRHWEIVTKLQKEGHNKHEIIQMLIPAYKDAFQQRAKLLEPLLKSPKDDDTGIGIAVHQGIRPEERSD